MFKRGDLPREPSLGEYHEIGTVCRGLTDEVNGIGNCAIQIKTDAIPGLVQDWQWPIDRRSSNHSDRQIVVVWRRGEW